MGKQRALLATFKGWHTAVQLQTQVQQLAALRLPYRAWVDQPEQDQRSSHAEEGQDVGYAAGVSQGVALADEVVVEQ